MKLMKIGNHQIEIPLAIVGNCPTCNNSSAVFDFYEIFENVEGEVMYECESGCGTTWALKFGVTSNEEENEND
jgi:hypothetical protein